MSTVAPPSPGTEVIVFTDGACSGNPGPGGWAALLRYQGHEKELSGYDPDTTNNRMELMAVIEGLRALKRFSNVCVVTDSRYVADGVVQWLPGWKARGWRRADKQPIKNLDLWQILDTLVAAHTIRWQWVRGHSGHPENERVDQLARAEIERNAATAALRLKL